MDIGTLIGLVIGVGSVVFSAVVSLIVVVVSIVLPVAIMGVVFFVVVKQLQSGQATLVMSGPAAALLAAAATPSVPKANRLKKISCTTCGGSKLVPPKTAYVYCDYCGTLVDWDFQIACKTAGSAKPGPEYERLVAALGPKQAAAKSGNDRDGYAAVTRQIFDKHFASCPGSWSPRLGDPEYREAMLSYTVASYTAAAFDPECSALEHQMNSAVKTLKWIPAFPQPKADPRTFDALVDAVLAHNHRFTGLAEPFLDTHPDQASISLQRRISRSAFAQGWMPYLDKPAQDGLIDKLELGGEYIEVPTIDTTERHCGGCARTLRVVAGAKKVVCEDCGHTSDVSHPEIACTGCGGMVSVRWSKRSFQCPSCSLELRVD